MFFIVFESVWISANRSWLLVQELVVLFRTEHETDSACLLRTMLVRTQDSPTDSTERHVRISLAAHVEAQHKFSKQTIGDPWRKFSRKLLKWQDQRQLFVWAKVILKCRNYGQAVPLTGERRPSRDRIPTPFLKDRWAEHPKNVIQCVQHSQGWDPLHFHWHVFFGLQPKVLDGW